MPYAPMSLRRPKPARFARVHAGSGEAPAAGLIEFDMPLCSRLASIWRPPGDSGASTHSGSSFAGSRRGIKAFESAVGAPTRTHLSTEINRSHIAYSGFALSEFRDCLHC